MNHVVLVGALPESLINFRGELIRTLVAAGYTVTAMAAPSDSDMVSKIEKLGAKFIAYPVQRNGLSPLADLQTLLTLYWTFRKLRPDIVLSYTIKPVIWGGVASRLCGSIRFCALITGLGFTFQGNGIKRRTITEVVTRLYRIALAKASIIVFQNPDNMSEFVKRRIVSRDKCRLVNGSGVDISRFAETSLPEQGMVFLTIARLLGEKGLREYAVAAKRVKQKFPQARFLLVGPEDSSPDGISLTEVKNWHEQGWVEYHGAQSDVRPFLANCHVYVLPSYHEGMPRTVLEAMATGRPILTTDVSGCRETVISGENGYLVPKGDSSALVERIIWFIEHRSDLDIMGSKSRALAIKRFDVNNVNSELMEIIGL